MGYRDILDDIGKIKSYDDYQAQQKQQDRKMRQASARSDQARAQSRKAFIEKSQADLRSNQQGLETINNTFDNLVKDAQKVVDAYITAGYPEDHYKVISAKKKIDTFNKQRDIKSKPIIRTIEQAQNIIDNSDSYSDEQITGYLKSGNIKEPEIQQSKATHLPGDQKPTKNDYVQTPTRDYKGSDVLNSPRMQNVEGSPTNQIDPAQQTWDKVQGSDLKTTNQIDPATGAPITTNNTNGALNATGATGTQPGVSGDVIETSGQPGIEQALAAIDADTRIPDDLKPLFKQVAQNWNPNQELNIDNVLAGFSEIKKSTIDPYFAEQIQQFTNDLQSTLDYQQKNQEMETEQMKTTTGKNIEGAQANLESRGMTFSGEGVKQLGAKSAYNQKEGTIPGQTPFAGKFVEGEVNQANRLMATSTQLRQKKAMKDLARQAEKTLGSTGMANTGLKAVGDVTQGTIAQQKQKAEVSALNSVYNQQQNLNQYSDQVKIFK